MLIRNLQWDCHWCRDNSGEYCLLFRSRVVVVIAAVVALCEDCVVGFIILFIFFYICS